MHNQHFVEVLHFTPRWSRQTATRAVQQRRSPACLQQRWFQPVCINTAFYGGLLLCLYAAIITRCSAVFTETGGWRVRSNWTVYKGELVVRRHQRSNSGQNIEVLTLCTCNNGLYVVTGKTQLVELCQVLRQVCVCV